MSDLSLDDHISSIREFNRFFTRQIGLLREGLLHTPYSLTEARILFEIAHRNDLTAAELCRELGLDAGYLSRILSRFEEQGQLEKFPSSVDRRQLLLRLTAKGQKTFGFLDQRSRDEVSEMLKDLSDEDRHRLLASMKSIETILTKNRTSKFSGSFYLRPPEPGDLGWIIYRHGYIYARDYGWDSRFEALVAQIMSDYITNFNPVRERCWIAEMDGEIVGSIFLVRIDDSTAKLRLLLVEQKARGLGLGTRLVEECIRFARKVGYQKITLWTNSVLVEARHIYQKTGFQLMKQEDAPNFGKELVSETWELDLNS